MRLKRNVKKFFRLITRRRVLGLLGLFGVGAYAFLDPTNENIHRAVRSVRSTVNQVKFDQPVVHDEPQYMLPPTDDSLPECPYETADLRKFFIKQNIQPVMRSNLDKPAFTFAKPKV